MKTRRNILGISVALIFLFSFACSTAYKAKPVPFKTPTAYSNATRVADAVIGAKAYVDQAEAKDAFGFDVRGAGMLPVQMVFDNQGEHTLEIDATQSFLEDHEGNLWPILSEDMAYERATKYAQTKQVFKEGAYSGFMGAAAGAVIGAAMGIVTGENVGEAMGKGAAAGAAAGATLGGIRAYGSDDARWKITEDLRQKSLESRPIEPRSLAYGFLFFPGEAKSAKSLRIRIKEADTGASHPLIMNF